MDNVELINWCDKKLIELSEENDRNANLDSGYDINKAQNLSGKLEILQEIIRLIK